MTKQSTMMPAIALEDVTEFEHAVIAATLKAASQLANKTDDSSAAAVKFGVWFNGQFCRSFIESVQITEGSISTVQVEVHPDDADGEIHLCTVGLKAGKWIVNPFVRVEQP